MRAWLPLVLMLLVSGGAEAIAQPGCPVAEPPAGQHDRNALWRIVHCQCAPARAAALAPPWPCTAMSPEAALLKDERGPSQYLLIPIERVTGIEDLALLRPNAPNYMAQAWRTRGVVGLALGRGLPRDVVGLAVNPIAARSQDQLHIHIDCLRPDVHAAIAGATIGETWAPLGAALAGWQARRMAGEGEGLRTNPFLSLYESIPGAATTMGEWTLLVTMQVGTGTAGFVALAGRFPETSSAERLLDRGCTLGR